MPTPGPTDDVPSLLTSGEIVLNLGAVEIGGAEKLMKLNEEGRKLMDSVGGVEQFQKLSPEAKKQKAGIYKGYCAGGKVQGFAKGGMVQGYAYGDKVSDPLQAAQQAASTINSARHNSTTPRNAASNVGGQAGSAANSALPDIGAASAPKLPEVGSQMPKITDTTGVQSTVGNIANAADTGALSKISATPSMKAPSVADSLPSANLSQPTAAASTDSIAQVAKPTVTDTTTKPITYPAPNKSGIYRNGNSFSDNKSVANNGQISTPSGNGLNMQSPNNQLAIANMQLRDGGLTTEQVRQVSGKADNLTGQLPSDFKAASAIGTNPSTAGEMKAGNYATLNPSEPKYLPETGPAKTSSGNPLVASPEELQGFSQGGVVKGGIFKGLGTPQGYDGEGAGNNGLVKPKITFGDNPALKSKLLEAKYASSVAPKPETNIEPPANTKSTAGVTDYHASPTEVAEANLSPKDTVVKEGVKPGIANLSATETAIKSRPPVYDVQEVQPEHIDIPNKGYTPDESKAAYEEHAPKPAEMAKTAIQESIERNVGIGKGHPTNYRPLSKEAADYVKSQQSAPETATTNTAPTERASSPWESPEPAKPIIPENLKAGAKALGESAAKSIGTAIAEPTNAAMLADTVNENRLQKGLGDVATNKAGIYTKAEVPIRGALSAASRLGPAVAEHFMPKEGQEKVNRVRESLSNAVTDIPEYLKTGINAVKGAFGGSEDIKPEATKAPVEAKSDAVKAPIEPKKDQGPQVTHTDLPENEKVYRDNDVEAQNQGLPEGAPTKLNEVGSGQGLVQGANGKQYSATKEGIFKFDPKTKAWSKLSGPSTGAPKQSEAATKAGTTDFWLNRGYAGGADQWKQEQADAAKEQQIQNLRNAAMQGPTGDMDPVSFGNAKRAQHLAQQQLLSLESQSGKGAEHNLQNRRLANEEANTAATREATKAEREYQHGALEKKQALDERKLAQQNKLAEAVMGNKEEEVANRPMSRTILVNGQNHDVKASAKEMPKAVHNVYQSEFVNNYLKGQKAKASDTEQVAAAHELFGKQKNHWLTMYDKAAPEDKKDINTQFENLTGIPIEEYTKISQ